ncbi:hypothetical protein [Rhodopirellula sp. MGV]|uniref:hypothetical protein n=1 Tax=Rhodopirellula sp. MGV TaxID=2023130 RepID=UPI000B97BC5D|nr:hypothetical protein [Rhodopirellula sp. MGV]OYP37381.1 hypothetical protein CGZ80_05360 [Rhodopirellula sp. MGV]PNY38040.1 hypothetical protein C2E31_04590 [Rhodopirellula baltica]
MAKLKTQKLETQSPLLASVESATLHPNWAALRVLENATTIATISSHLGRSLPLHRHACKYLTLAMMQARMENRVLLIAKHSAIEPWAIRAAETFGVPYVMVTVNGSSRSNVLEDQARPCVNIETDQPLGRDQAIVELADRVDCVFVRAGGTVETVLRNRLLGRRDASVRVATPTPSKLMPETSSSQQRKANQLFDQLLELGAIGWHRFGQSSDRLTPNECDSVSPEETLLRQRDSEWCDDDENWLVHCTRACHGPWPGETVSQYRDWVMLSESDSATALLDGYRGTCLGSLSRILRMKRLVASALTSCRDTPVVCFANCSLSSLLARRCYRPHLHRWDYEPYGIAIRKDAAYRAGVESVLYGSPEERKSLPADQRFRFQAEGRTFDWTAEREWRFDGNVDLDVFDQSDIRVFVPSDEEARTLRTEFPITTVGHFLAK